MYYKIHWVKLVTISIVHYCLETLQNYCFCPDIARGHCICSLGIYKKGYNSLYCFTAATRSQSAACRYAPPQWRLKALCDCPFLQWKDEIANPCNFSAQEEEKLGEGGGEKKTRTQSELSFWPNITFPSPRTAEVGSSKLCLHTLFNMS